MQHGFVRFEPSPKAQHGKLTLTHTQLLVRLCRAGAPGTALGACVCQGSPEHKSQRWKGRWLWAVSVLRQTKSDAVGLCTRRWQGGAVHAAFTSTTWRSRAFLGRDFKALSGAMISCLKISGLWLAFIENILPVPSSPLKELSVLEWPELNPPDSNNHKLNGSAHEGQKLQFRRFSLDFSVPLVFPQTPMQ